MRTVSLGRMRIGKGATSQYLLGKDLMRYIIGLKISL
jgi:hypothetical protein